MENNFDIKKYLVENKMTRNSRLLNESFESEIEENEIELDEQESSLEDELMAQLDETETEELDETDFDSLEEAINTLLEKDDLDEQELNEDIYSDLATFVAGPAAVGAVSLGIAKLMDALESGKLGGEKGKQIAKALNNIGSAAKSQTPGSAD